MLKRLLLLASATAILAGCTGTNALTPSTFVGTYSGTWVNTADADDDGTSTWAVGADGTVTGVDVDPGRDTAFDVVGTIDEHGNLSSTSTPRDGSEAATLNGQLQFNNEGKLTGLLVWGVEPPLTYRYTFTRH